MIRAYSFTLARFLFVAGFLSAVLALGSITQVSTASARVSPDFPVAEITFLDQKSRESLTVLAQKKRYKNRRRDNRYQNRRQKKTRSLNNRQSNSAVSSGRAASLGTVARSVRRRVPGQLLDARLLKDRRGNLTYRLKILDRNGVMRNVTADAYSGAILGVR